jgi:hypothetical protein
VQKSKLVVAALVACLGACGVGAHLFKGSLLPAAIFFVVVAVAARIVRREFPRVGVGVSVFATIGAMALAIVEIALLNRGSEALELAVFLALPIVLFVLFWKKGSDLTKSSVTLALVTAIISIPYIGRAQSQTIGFTADGKAVNIVPHGTNTVTVTVYAPKGLDPNDEAGLRRFARAELIRRGMIADTESGLVPAALAPIGIAGMVIIVLAIFIVSGYIIYRLIRFCQEYLGTPPPPPQQPPPPEEPANQYADPNGYGGMQIVQIISVEYFGECVTGPDDPSINPSTGLTAASFTTNRTPEQLFEIETIVYPSGNARILKIGQVPSVHRRTYDQALANWDLNIEDLDISVPLQRPGFTNGVPVAVINGIPTANPRYWPGPFFLQTLSRAPSPGGPWTQLFQSIGPASVTNKVQAPLISQQEWRSMRNSGFYKFEAIPWNGPLTN